MKHSSDGLNLVKHLNSTKFLPNKHSYYTLYGVGDILRECYGLLWSALEDQANEYYMLFLKLSSKQTVWQHLML